MRVAVTGTTGRVGAALVRRLASRHDVLPLPRDRFDLSDRNQMARVLQHLHCDVLVHPAAITGLETCEDDPALAMRVNAEAPGEMADWAAGRGVQMIHFSTDYVFDGCPPGLRGEDEAAAPVSIYGRSKLAGEQAVLAHPAHLVVRVSWAFGPEKPSFVDQIFVDALAGRSVAAVADKFSLPTFTSDLAEWVQVLIEKQATGIVHACNSGEPTSWHGMAGVVLETMMDCGAIGGLPELIELKLADVAAFRATRPRFTAMETTRLTEWLGRAPRPWRDALASHVSERCRSL